MRITITEAQAESMCDRRVMKRLDIDSAYLNAENADEQKAREEAIEQDVWADIERRYDIAP